MLSQGGCLRWHFMLQLKKELCTGGPIAGPSVPRGCCAAHRAHWAQAAATAPDHPCFCDALRQGMSPCAWATAGTTNCSRVVRSESSTMLAMDARRARCGLQVQAQCALWCPNAESIRVGAPQQAQPAQETASSTGALMPAWGWNAFSYGDDLQPGTHLPHAERAVFVTHDRDPKSFLQIVCMPVFHIHVLTSMCSTYTKLSRGSCGLMGASKNCGRRLSALQPRAASAAWARTTLYRQCLLSWSTLGWPSLGVTVSTQRGEPSTPSMPSARSSS